MVRELIHDPILLAKPAKKAEKADLDLGLDLLMTLLAHKETCVGMAANMVGESKAIIVFSDLSRGKEAFTLMFNPEIIAKEGAYEAEEGCLSYLGGPKKAKRWHKIKVRYQNRDFQTRIKTYSGKTAQIIQHEVDHLMGVLI